MSTHQPYPPSGMPLPQPTVSTGQHAPLPPTPQAFHSPQPMSTHYVDAGQGVPQSLAPPPSAPVQTATIQVPQAAAATAASQDDDNAQLDEVWINKAREVVAKTQYDPYLQSNELSKLKAGYLKSRYNKDIKISEDRPQ